MNKPNVLLITSDQQHWCTLGFQNPQIDTPNLDRLAKMGTTYNRAYCPNPRIVMIFFRNIPCTILRF